MGEYAPKALIPDCTLFNGYKPCLPYKVCEGCPDPRPFGRKILLINLDNIGAVLMTTAQLPAVKRAWPESTVYWLTQPGSRPVLEHNPLLHEVLPWGEESRLLLRQMTFDVVLNADKDRLVCAFVNELQAPEKRGFGLNPNGAIVPLNRGAEAFFALGLDDRRKFHENRRTGQELLAEALELPYERDHYVLQLSESEREASLAWRRNLDLEGAAWVVGLNTGCSDLFPNKRLLAAQQAELCRRLADLEGVRVILLGGPEDTERNREIAALAGGVATETPTTLGLRTGIVLENLADIVISGDSLGMHIAIALQKYVIAWFGLSCAPEIDLYDRGVKLVRDLPCAPCWKKVCDMPHGPICVTEFDLDAIVARVKAVVESAEPLSQSESVAAGPAEVLV